MDGLRRFPWTALLAGSWLGAAVMGLGFGDWPPWLGASAALLAVGLAGEAWRRVRARDRQSDEFWAGQLGRVAQGFGKPGDEIVVADRDGRIAWASPAYCRRAEKPLSTLKGDPLLPTEWAGCGMADLRRLREGLDGGGVWRVGRFRRDGDGRSRAMEQWAVGVRDPDGGFGYFVGLIREAEVTEQSLAELTEANESLEARLLQVTSELGQFKRELEMMSFALGHQLRCARIGLAEVRVALGLDRPEVLPPGVRREVDWIMRSGSKMMRLMESLGWLHELRTKRLDWRQVDLGEMAEEILDGFSRAEPARTLRFVRAPGLRAQGDARLLHCMLSNLLANAWKYTRGGSNPEIEFGETSGADRRRIFFVRDNGVGVDRQGLERIFEGRDLPGYSNGSEDVRLGLVVVHRILERHGGRIWAETASGGGTVFRFTLGDAPDDGPSVGT